MSWLREAMYWWAGPDGTLTSAESAEGHAGAAYDTLLKFEMGKIMPAKPQPTFGPKGPEVKYKGTSGEEAKYQAQQILLDRGITLGSNEALRVMMDEYGYVSISDAKMLGADYWAHARSADDVIKAEDGISKLVFNGPLGVYTQDGSQFILTPEALQEAMDKGHGFDQVVQDAVKVGVRGSLKGAEGWGTNPSKPISYFR
jgi:hypothetical protein